MFTNNKLSKAVRLAVAFGAASTAAFTGAVAAQEAGEAKDVERIEVTGSRIKRVDLETASPVTVIGRDEIDAGGFSNIGQLLTTLNQADSLGLTNVTSDTNGNDGSQTVSLRGVGTSRTLVLVDGRRWLALGGGQVDISQIPVSAIERVEVLADGASALYGSDAIGGVINIITRKDYEGFEFDVGTGASFEGDGESTTYGFTLGTATEKSNLFLNFSRVEQKEIMAGDREISSVPIAGTTLGNSSFGEYGLFLVNDEYLALDPSKEGAGTRTPDDYVLSDGIYGRSDDYPVTSFNFAPQNYLLTPSDRSSVFVKASHQITDNVKAFSQFTYNQRKSVSKLAAVPLTNFFSGPQWRIPISADNVYNPFGVDISGSGYRMTAAGPRTRFQDYDTYFATVGFEGDFEVADRSVYWDIAYSRGESSRHQTGENYINLDRLAKGLGDSFVDAGGVARCGTPGAVIAGCVPVNLFNGVTGMTPEMVQYIAYTQQEKESSGVTMLGGNFSTELFELPAGAVAVAAGVEKRTDQFVSTPDAIVASGFGSDNFVEATNGSKEAVEYYAELSVPVLRDVAFAQALDLSLATRTSEFKNNGTVGLNKFNEDFDNTSSKIGLTYVPFEGLMLRGNYAETFRAPSVDDLFAGGAESFGSATDLCSNSSAAGNAYSNLTAAQQARCLSVFGVGPAGAPQPTSQIRQLTGGNPFLQPEEGTTRTIGFVYNPDFIENFDVSVDWWNIELEQVISTLSANSIMSSCIRDNDDTACSFIERDGTGQVQTIRRAGFNLASVEVEGVDVNTTYKYDAGEYGVFSVNYKGTYTISAKTAIGALSEVESVVGEAVGAFSSPTWRIRSNLALKWNYSDVDVDWTMRHTSTLREDCLANEVAAGVCNNAVLNSNGTANLDDSYNRIGSVVYHDLSAGYELPWNANIRVGTRNLFRKDPPISLSAFANSFLQAYDLPGGSYFVNYRQKF